MIIVKITTDTINFSEASDDGFMLQFLQHEHVHLKPDEPRADCTKSEASCPSTSVAPYPQVQGTEYLPDFRISSHNYNATVIVLVINSEVGFF